MKEASTFHVEDLKQEEFPVPQPSAIAMWREVSEASNESA